MHDAEVRQHLDSLAPAAVYRLVLCARHGVKLRQFHLKSLSLIHIYTVVTPTAVLKLRLRSCEKEATNSALPVSYTHLDVYKRQYLYLLFQIVFIRRKEEHFMAEQFNYSSVLS